MVDLGEAEPRQFFAGLRASYPRSDRADRPAHRDVIYNLKPRQMKFGLSERHGPRRQLRGVARRRRHRQAGRPGLMSAPRDSLRSQPDRLPAHRRRAHGAVQLAVRPAARRAVHAAHRRHRSAAQRRGGAGADPPRLPLAGHRLGRRPRSRRARTRRTTNRSGGALSGRRRRAAGAGAAYRDYATTEEMQAERKAAEAEKRQFPYSRRWMAATDARSRALRSRRAQGVVRLQDAARGQARARATSCAARSSSQWARGAGPRHPARRRHVPLPPGQRRRRSRLRDLARDPRRGAPVEHAAAGVHRAGAGHPAARVRAPAVRRRTGQQEQAQQAQARQVSQEPRLRPGEPARHGDRRGDGARRPRPRRSIR